MTVLRSRLGMPKVTNKKTSRATRRRRAEPNSPTNRIRRGLRLLSPLSIAEQVIAGLLLALLAATAGVVTKHVAERSADPPAPREFQAPTSQWPPSTASAQTTIKPTSTTLHQPSTTRDAGPPVRIVSITLERSDLQGGWVFPQRLDVRPAELKAMNSMQKGSPPFDAWFRSRGAVDPNLSIVKIVAEGNRDNAVRILGMRALKRCRSPLTGTLFLEGSEAGDDSIMIGFDLDSDDANARVATPISIGRGSYFASKTISLKDGEQQVLQVLASTRRYYCEYRLQMSVLDEGKTVTEVIGDGNEPFRVSSFATSASGNIAYPRYRALYAGGVVSPKGDASYVRVDPATFRP
jgi:hypothetical protein